MFIPVLPCMTPVLAGLNSKSSSMLAVLAISICIQAALPQIASASDPLGLGSWDTIVSIEHTGEYLAKAGGFDVATAGKVVVPDVEGNWSFNLTDVDAGPAGIIFLRLFQSGSILFGYGTIRSQSGIQNATADGSALGSGMVLGVVSLKSTDLYRLTIAEISGTQASGTFSVVAPSGGDSIKGAISGIRYGPEIFEPAGNA